MAPAVVSGSGEHPEFEGRITVYVIVCVVIAAFGGLMFGYDIGISAVYRKKQHVLENNYCKYDNQSLQLFTSSLYLAALIASFVASKVCSKAGRKLTMQIASIFFLIGVVLTAGGVNLGMIILGRIFLGFGVGFANQAVPLFLSEIAPARIRGALNITNIHPNGWRISLGIAGVPALMLCLGSILICETPTSLIERNKIEEGRKVLRKIRGVENVDDEFNSIVHACEMARQVKDPFRKLMKPVSRPPLVIAICLQVFQQFTGINAIMFYAPVLFQTIRQAGDFCFLKLVSRCLFPTFIIGIILLKELKPRADYLTKGEATFVVTIQLQHALHFRHCSSFPLNAVPHASWDFFFFAGWIVIMGVFTWFFLPETKGVPVDSMVDKVGSTGSGVLSWPTMT
ncbi:Sugar transport protein 8 [Hibiscus syriacus]|uniref:Sugar transport protein 8 n=1 Tax=Hibiscus syriacus TaxID=106335 RepID=A0A6A2ZEP0_HIBSY|nr:Sugar transport protein 8 [Hibiscus syriacus]